jgi:flagellin
MALAIATNNAALQAAASASSVNRDMETSMARLSSGKRINSASDDAAGVAIASRLSSEIRGTDQAIRNAMDSQALIDTSEGAHKEIENILQRMREISVQAANDTNSFSDRSNLQAEMNALMIEIDRIASVTTWAGQSLMSNSGSTSDFTFQVGTATGTKNQITVNIKDMSTDTSVANGGIGMTTAAVTSTNHAQAAFTSTTDVAANTAGTVLTIDADTNGGVSKFTFLTQTITSDTTGLTTATAANNAIITAEIADKINSNAYYISKGVTAAVDSSDPAKINMSYGTHKGHMLSAAGARASVANIDAAIKSVNTQRSELGAVSNRLSHTVNNLTNISANLSAAKGGIEDSDFAIETTNLAKNQILQQASTAMLAQANAAKQNVLSLLQG